MGCDVSKGKCDVLCGMRATYDEAFHWRLSLGQNLYLLNFAFKIKVPISISLWIRYLQQHGPIKDVSIGSSQSYPHQDGPPRDQS